MSFPFLFADWNSDPGSCDHKVINFKGRSLLQFRSYISSTGFEYKTSGLQLVLLWKIVELLGSLGFRL